MRALHCWQAALAEAHPGLAATLYRRSDAGTSLDTWMETYACPPQGIAEVLAQQLRDGPGGSLGRMVDGVRHVEVFDRVDAGPRDGA